MYRNRGMYESMTSAVTKACDCLINCDMKNEAIDGLRMISFVMAKEGKQDTAMALAEYLILVETRVGAPGDLSAVSYYKFIIEYHHQ